MVEPSRFADTVAPSSGLPAARIEPVSTGSAAKAESAIVESAKPAMSRFISISLLLGDGADVGDDGVDLVWLQVVFERRHAAAAVRDESAREQVVSGGGRLGERRAVGLG